MDLIIVESPKKAKTIEKYLGNKYRVLASAEHICDLPEKKLGIDIANDFKPEYQINPSKKDIVEKLKKEVAKSDKVFLATDPDREGEAISWHLSNELNIHGDKIRIEFNEITKKAVTNALNNPREINMNLVDAQQARRVLDRLVGYIISPILSTKIKNGMSAGRVQSVALKLIVDRENEIRNFKVEEYWNLYATLTRKDNAKLKMKAQLATKCGKKIKIGNKDDADIVIKDLENSVYVVSKMKNSVQKVHPSAPFTTSTLQQVGSSRLKLSSPEIMKYAQQLYEGVDIPGEGHVALVTYIRTDSVRISQEAQIACREYIIKKYGQEYCPKTFNYYKNKDAAQDAHEAIRPVSLENTPEKLKDKLTNKNLYRLYKLIFDRFVASQMESALYDTVSIDITATPQQHVEIPVGVDTAEGVEISDGVEIRENAEAAAKDLFYGLKVSGKSIKFDGFLKLNKNSDDDDDAVNSKLLPVVEVGDVLNCEEVKGEQKFTTPPPRFTDATLVKEMEDCGIGRPSTYASIITVIQTREYVTKEELEKKKDKVFVPTKLGEKVVELMNKYFPDIMNVNFTAQMESDLDKIEQGIQWQTILRNFYPNFNAEVQKAKNDRTRMHLDAEVTDVICEKCGANMLLRDGKFGKFYACPNYPSCSNTKPYGEVVSTCPACGGNVIKRKSKAGKTYYSCFNAPKCNFFSMDLPAPFYCPKCKSTVKMAKKGKYTWYKCTSQNCDYLDKILTPVDDDTTDGD